MARKCTPKEVKALKKEFIKQFKKCGNRETSAFRAGISTRSILNWIHNDVVFAGKVVEAEFTFKKNKLGQ